MSDENQSYRKYAGLVFVVIAYVGGLIGWTWAAVTVDPAPPQPNEVQTPASSPAAPGDGGP